MGSLSLIHWLILGAIGILLFGKRLPEMGRYFGKTIIEFKKGMKGLEDGDGDASAGVRPVAPIEPPRPPPRVTTNIPKFEDNPNNVTPPQS
ncbi:MAG TPA: twin-arginine translocase TatA/TatE family subunit [Gemmataceae bacterium]|jgi:sec-independent protein translocase protein TatA|nr:twin-arginine translocase TatA/TatE family subunit [Gemmataceae bacterium]